MFDEVFSRYKQARLALEEADNAMLDGPLAAVQGLLSHGQYADAWDIVLQMPGDSICKVFALDAIREYVKEQRQT